MGFAGEIDNILFFEQDHVFSLLFSQYILKQKPPLSHSSPSEKSRTSQRNSNVTQCILLHSQRWWSKTPAPVRQELNGRAPRWNLTSCSPDILPVRESKTHTVLHTRFCNTCMVKVTPFCLLDRWTDTHLLPAVGELSWSPN